MPNRRKPDALGAAPPLPPLSPRGELARKSLHVSSAIVPVGYAAGVPWSAVALLLAILLSAALAVELVRERSLTAQAHFLRTTGRLLREHEHHRWSGATWLLLSFLTAVLVLPRDIAVAAMWAVSIGDAAAALVGRSLGTPRTTGGKTKAGALACWAATGVGAALVAQLGVAQSLVAATAAAAAEWPRRPLDDNLRIVAAVSAGILLWRIVFP